MSTSEPWRRHTLGDLLHRSAARFPNKLAIVCGPVRWTYREFDALCDRLAAGLAEQGIVKGDRVAILARNSHAFAALRFALARLGAVLVADQLHAQGRRSGLHPAPRRGAPAGHRQRPGPIGPGRGSAGHGRAAVPVDAGRNTIGAGARHAPFRDTGGLRRDTARCAAERQRPGADRLHQRHRIPAQGRDAHARRGDVAVRQLRGRCQHCQRRPDAARAAAVPLARSSTCSSARPSTSVPAT